MNKQLTHIVTSQELSQGLYDNGLRVESMFWWNNVSVPRMEINGWGVSDKKEREDGGSIPALTLNELLELLPDIVKGYEFYFGKCTGGYVTMYDNDFRFEDKSPEDVCAKLAITLHDEGIINLADLSLSK